MDTLGELRKWKDKFVEGTRGKAVCRRWEVSDLLRRVKNGRLRFLPALGQLTVVCLRAGFLGGSKEPSHRVQSDD